MKYGCGSGLAYAYRRRRMWQAGVHGARWRRTRSGRASRGSGMGSRGGVCGREGRECKRTHLGSRASRWGDGGSSQAATVTVNVEEGAHRRAHRRGNTQS